jgi:hypothetical protein
VTHDLGGNAGTSEMATAICERLAGSATPATAG